MCLSEVGMKPNVGGKDRLLRIISGVILVGFTAPGIIGAWGWIGVIPLVTGLIRWCPFYPLAEISTAKNKQK